MRALIPGFLIGLAAIAALHLTGCHENSTADQQDQAAADPVSATPAADALSALAEGTAQSLLNPHGTSPAAAGTSALFAKAASLPTFTLNLQNLTALGGAYAPELPLFASGTGTSTVDAAGSSVTSSPVGNFLSQTGHVVLKLNNVVIHTHDGSVISIPSGTLAYDFDSLAGTETEGIKAKHLLDVTVSLNVTSPITGTIQSGSPNAAAKPFSIMGKRTIRVVEHRSKSTGLNDEARDYRRTINGPTAGTSFLPEGKPNRDLSYTNFDITMGSKTVIWNRNYEAFSVWAPEQLPDGVPSTTVIRDAVWLRQIHGETTTLLGQFNTNTASQLVGLPVRADFF